MADKGTITMIAKLPAICEELHVRWESGVAIVNSRDVAEKFEKQHGHVLRDIEALILTTPNLDWFRQVEYLDAKGEARPSYDLTRQGFTLLVMGWNGDRALTYKVRYIQAFDEMEEILKGEMPPVVSMIISGLREAIRPLAVRFDYQDHAIARVEKRVDGIAEDVAVLKVRILKNRRRIGDDTKRDHLTACVLFGGKCPCCGDADVVAGEEKSPFAEYDHFYENSLANADHTWLICKPCHTGSTTGRVPRHEREAEFRAYQAKRRRLPGRQPDLF